MAPNVPAPPPPLPSSQCSKLVNEQTSGGSSCSTQTKVLDGGFTAEQEFINAQNHLWKLEGWKERPIFSVYHYMPSIRQEGPQCGLVALAMASAHIDRRRHVSVQELLKDARSRGFSKYGEMFSVDNMASLAQTACPRSRILIIGNLFSNQDYVIQNLARGGILLVPYDADRNHQPCCLRGHKAHWAAVSGALVCSERCLVVARQGKSHRLMLWDYQQLAASNNNLVELSPSRCEDGNDYLVPAGGVQAGLCGRAVFLLPY